MSKAPSSTKKAIIYQGYSHPFEEKSTYQGRVVTYVVLEELFQLTRSKMTLRVVRINNAATEAKFVDLPIKDDFFHRAVGDKAVYVALPFLPVAIDPTHSLLIVRGVPGCIKDDDPVRRGQRDAERASTCRQHKDVAIVILGRIIKVCKKDDAAEVRSGQMGARI